VRASFAVRGLRRLRLAGVMALGLLLCGLGLAGRATGQEGESSAADQPTKQTGAMSEKVYRRLAEAQELADKEDYAGAQRILDEIKASPKLTPYEIAQLYNFYGYIYYARERYKDSIAAYETVLRQEQIPQGLKDSTRYTLAQLYFTIENWPKAVELINEWLKTAQNPGPEPYILLASAYYQQAENQPAKYKEMIPPIEKAMEIARARNQPVKEQWWLLLRVPYYEQQNYKKVRDILEVLVAQWPKKEYWTQLSAMYGELGQDAKQLGSYESAYDQGLLTRNGELVQLAQLFLQAEVPFKAARVLEKGMAAGQVEKSMENYRLLSQAWTLAMDDARSVPPLEKAASMSNDGDLDVRLANNYLNLSRYDQCVKAANSGIQKGRLERNDLAYMVLGMCQFERDQLEPAKSAFRKAAQDKRSAKGAQNWITYIEREQERLAQLERSLQQVRRVESESDAG